MSNGLDERGTDEGSAGPTLEEIGFSRARWMVYTAIIFAVLVAVIFTIGELIPLPLTEGVFLWMNAAIAGLISWFCGGLMEYSFKRASFEGTFEE